MATRDTRRPTRRAVGVIAEQRPEGATAGCDSRGLRVARPCPCANIHPLKTHTVTERGDGTATDARGGPEPDALGPTANGGARTALEEVELPRAIDGLAARHNAEFPVDHSEMRLHRVVRDREVLSNIAARHRRRQVSEHVALSRRQSLNKMRKPRLVGDEAPGSVHRGSPYGNRAVSVVAIPGGCNIQHVGRNHDVALPALLVRWRDWVRPGEVWVRLGGARRHVMARGRGVWSASRRCKPASPRVVRRARWTRQRPRMTTQPMSTSRPRPKRGEFSAP